MGMMNMCRFCGSDWCGGECVTGPAKALLDAAKKAARTGLAGRKNRIEFLRAIDAAEKALRKPS